MNSGVFPAKVVSVSDEYKVVINRGSIDGIKVGQRFLIYGMGDELFDPDTKESLGILEEVKGKGKAVHVQERLTTIESDLVTNERTKKIRTAINSFGVLRPLDSEEEIITPTKKPFDNPVEGDFAKPI